MLNRRVPLAGLLAVLLALMAQLGSGAMVPAEAALGGIVGVICHTDDVSHGTPAAPAHHPADCPLCPLCAAVHAPAVAIVAPAVVLTEPAAVLVPRVELPPPATAPPSPRRPPSQPRAPPTVS